MAEDIPLRLTCAPSALRRLRVLPWLRQGFRNSADRQEWTSIYFDTEKCKFRNNGVLLQVRHAGKNRLQIVEAEGVGGAAQRAGRTWQAAIPGEVPDLARAKHTALKPFVSKKLGRKLRPVFKTSIQRTTLPLSLHESHVELVVDRGQIRNGKRSEPVSEIELKRKDGNLAGLLKIAERLAKDLPVYYDIKTQAERGYALGEGRRIKAAHADAIILDGKARTGDSFKAIGWSCLRHLILNEDAVRKGDAEGIHQMRVALRRLRASISIFKEILQDPQSERVKAELKWLTEQLGPARDMDVLVKETVVPLREAQPRRKKLATLHTVLEERRSAEFEKAKQA